MKNSEKHSDFTSCDWNELQKHKEVMDLLSKMKGNVHTSFCDYGHCDYWHIDSMPSEDVLVEIVNRGVSEEILFLIHQFGKNLPEFGLRNNGCTACRGQFLQPVYMPDKVQGLIAKRGVKEEMEAFVSYYGFSSAGQDAILERGNHDEIMWYLSLHGLLPEQQKKLIERNDLAEIELHLKKHGMSEELLMKMFDKMEETGEEKDVFYMCIEGPDFPVKCQVRMLEVVSTQEFEAYVSRHGLWEEVHKDLILKRSVKEVAYYVEKHKYLSNSVDGDYIKNCSSRDRMFYLKYAHNAICSVIYDLICMDKIDEKALEYAFWNYDYKTFDVSKPLEVKLMEEGSCADIKLYFEKHKYLTMKAWASLFFRNRGLFAECASIFKKFFYKC